jgi:hypothetical protein
MHPSTYASIFVLELIDFFWQIYRRKMSKERCSWWGGYNVRA